MSCYTLKHKLKSSQIVSDWEIQNIDDIKKALLQLQNWPSVFNVFLLSNIITLKFFLWKSKQVIYSIEGLIIYCSLMIYSMGIHIFL